MNGPNTGMNRSVSIPDGRHARRAQSKVVVMATVLVKLLEYGVNPEVSCVGSAV